FCRRGIRRRSGVLGWFGAIVRKAAPAGFLAIMSRRESSRAAAKRSPATKSALEPARRPPLPPATVHAAVALLLGAVLLAGYTNTFDADFTVDNKVLIRDAARVQKATAENINLILTRSYLWPAGMTPGTGHSPRSPFSPTTPCSAMAIARPATSASTSGCT